MEVVSTAGTILVSVLVGTFVNGWLRRPLLRAVGSSWSSGRGLSIHFVNRPAVLGLDAPVSGRSRGLALARDSAQQCTAWLLDARFKEAVAGLSWAGEDWDAPSVITTIENGASQHVWLLARAPDVEGFRIYRPGGQHQRDVALPQELGIRIDYAFGMRSQTFRFEVTVNDEGVPQVRVKHWLWRRRLRRA